ncbi:MAG: DNA mismatch endonuclease Vsr [Candidatus Accumulibacter sp.]|jgi:DNA mismatch endonuclease (patch repair protein)|nr:DNA mismatch endonuclease Vsr [Accumulibacter sp.]
MVDTLTPAERSYRMSLVRSTDTKPEFAVRRLIHGMGYRYRIHRHDLPGTPDIVFPARRLVIFVHGCFWHRHDGCSLARMPKSKLEFWRKKLEGNRERDIRKIGKLESMGWRVLVVWECELSDLDILASRLRGFLDGGLTI